MKPRTFFNNNNKERSEDPIITQTSTFTCRCLSPLCAARLCGKYLCRNSKTSGKHPTDYDLSSGSLLPGELIFVDYYQSTVKGRLPNTFEKKIASKHYCGGIIFVDSSTRFTRVYHLVSLCAGDTIRHKNQFEQEAL